MAKYLDRHMLFKKEITLTDFLTQGIKMITVPCKTCITFAICKAKVSELRKLDKGKGSKGRIWLSLYFDCSIFNKFYDAFLTTAHTDIFRADRVLEKLYDLNEGELNG
jgi:hypothetical protein